MNDMSAVTQFASVEAEQQLLGAILTGNDRLNLVADFLRPEMFADPVHAEIYRQASARIRKGHIASPVTMKAVLGDHAGLAELGGASYLVRLAGAAIASGAVADYARVVVDGWTRRQIDAAIEDTRAGLSAGGDVAVLTAKLQHALMHLPTDGSEPSSLSLTSAVTRAVEEAVSAYQGKTQLLATGLPALDRIVRGLAPSDFMLIGGATSMGKTSVALHIAGALAEAGRGVAFVSLEMAPDQLATRLISARARVPYAALRDAAAMEEADFRKWVEAARPVSEGTMRIVPRHVRDIPAIDAACRKIRADLERAKVPLSLVVVDYAQLVRGEGKTRYEQMTSVSIGLKTIAGLLEVPVIGLVQLSRDIGQRDHKRPMLTDIKETGQFENDADQAVFCHRESYWLERQGPKPNAKGDVTPEIEADWRADLARWRNKMELIVQKNRHGPIATAEVGFHDATNRFWSLGDEQAQEAFI